jgi:hypothetical protein
LGSFSHFQVSLSLGGRLDDAVVAKNHPGHKNKAKKALPPAVEQVCVIPRSRVLSVLIGTTPGRLEHELFLARAGIPRAEGASAWRRGKSVWSGYIIDATCVNARAYAGHKSIGQAQPPVVGCVNGIARPSGYTGRRDNPLYRQDLAKIGHGQLPFQA